MSRVTSVLFICTGNSCRSIMAEALLAHHGRGRFIARSAGSHPTGSVHPKSLEALAMRGLPTSDYRSKSIDEVAQTHVDIVVTVCDAAVDETCPIFPAVPLKTHWGVRDPANATGTDTRISQEFPRVCDLLEKRIKALVALPVETMDRDNLQAAINEIGLS